MFQFIASYTQRKTYQRITRTLKIFQARFNVCFIVRQSPEILAIFHFRVAYKWEDMSRKFPCVLFLSYFRCFQFPSLSSRERPWTLCLISYSYANWPPSGHGENKGTVFQGRRCGFYDSKCPSFNSEVPEYKFSSPDSETEMKKVDFFDFGVLTIPKVRDWVRVWDESQIERLGISSPSLPFPL